MIQICNGVGGGGGGGAGGGGDCAVHVSIPHGPFLLLGRTDVGAVAGSSGPH
jgi:hypothetical protein